MAQWQRIHLQCRRHKRHRFDPWVGKTPWRRAWQPTPVFLPGESHGQRSLVGCSPWVGRDWGDWAHAHVHTGKSLIQQIFKYLSHGRNKWHAANDVLGCLSLLSSISPCGSHLSLSQFLWINNFYKFFYLITCTQILLKLWTPAVLLRTPLRFSALPAFWYNRMFQTQLLQTLESAISLGSF